MNSLKPDSQGEGRQQPTHRPPRRLTMSRPVSGLVSSPLLEGFTHHLPMPEDTVVFRCDLTHLPLRGQRWHLSNQDRMWPASRLTWRARTSARHQDKVAIMNRHPFFSTLTIQWN